MSDFESGDDRPKFERDPAKCLCTTGTPPPSPPVQPDCQCPRDDLDIVIHEETCLMYKHDKIMYPHEAKECECPPITTRICECCRCLEDQCHCKKAGREAFDEWRKNRDVGPMPIVLETTHPLMQKFQESLRRFLEKENEIAEAEIVSLRDELATGKRDYDRELEGIYRSDHDTNAQRLLIEEYENTLANERKTREEAEERARVVGESLKACKEKLNDEMLNHRDSRTELEALVALVRQLETWREETDSNLIVSQRMTEKMKHEKRAIADEKRQLDMFIYGLNNEVWKLQSRMELFKSQMEIKNKEMDKVVDKVTAYGTELEDLELDKKRLISMWNSVLVNINQRDKVFDSMRTDYRQLQENYCTLVVNLENTKKFSNDQMNRSKELAMNRDKHQYDLNAVNKLFENEDHKRETLEIQIEQFKESLELNDRDQEMVKMENFTLRNILSTTSSEINRRSEHKIKMENEILENLRNCMLNDKSVQAMANGIKNMRDMSRKLEISLMAMENQHAKVMLEIEIHKSRQGHVAMTLEKSLQQVRDREKEVDALQEKYRKKSMMMYSKQRELDIVQKKFSALKAIFDLKSPQERRIVDLEQQIRDLRDRTEGMQQNWMRLQGHVVRVTQQHQNTVADIALLNNQLQIVEQRMMLTLSQLEHVNHEREKVDRVLRDLRGRLTVLERARKDYKDRTDETQRANQALSHEYAANLKDAESGLIALEDDIESLEKEKTNLTQDLDRVSREALVWQRKGILAVELKRNMKNAQSAAGEIGQMKNEIHRMEVRREQLRHTADKLSDDLALYVMRRETAVDKSRASAAVEKARGAIGRISQSNYKHKLRLIKSDVNRVTKELADVKIQVKQLLEDQERLDKEIEKYNVENGQLEENIATLLRECRVVDRDKQWLLERVVRNQRLGSELQRAVKRQSLRIRKPKNTILFEHEQAKELNNKLRYIVDQLMRDYPYMEEKLLVVANTLNIFTPSTSPRFTDEGLCTEWTEKGDFGCILPSEEEVPEPETPYCRQEKDTCVECKCTETKVE